MGQNIINITENFGLVHRFLLFAQCSDVSEKLKEGDKEFQSREICRFFQEAGGTYTGADFDDFRMLAETKLDLAYIIGWWDRNVGGSNSIVDGLRASLARRKFHIVGKEADSQGGK